MPAYSDVPASPGHTDLQRFLGRVPEIGVTIDYHAAYVAIGLEVIRLTAIAPFPAPRGRRLSFNLVIPVGATEVRNDQLMEALCALSRGGADVFDGPD